MARRNPNSAPGTPPEPESGDDGDDAPPRRPRRNPRAAPTGAAPAAALPSHAIEPVEPPESCDSTEVVSPDDVLHYDELTDQELEYLSRAVALLGLLLVKRLLPKRPRVEWNAAARAWILERVEDLIADLRRNGNETPF